MGIVLVLLLDNEISNYVRKRAYQINKKYETGLRGSLLPPHISLKQPFECKDIEALEGYVSTLAESIDPFEVEFSGISYWNTDGIGTIFLNVEESNKLRKLHNRINKELRENFENTEAPFDGDEYSFHTTISHGVKVSKKIFDDIEDKAINLKCTVKEMAILYSDEEYTEGRYLVYKVLNLGGKDNL